MVSLGQKLKMPKKNAKHHSTKRSKLFCGKTTRKNTQYSRIEKTSKISYLAKAIAHPKAMALQNGQFGSKIKNAKNMRKPFYKKIRVVLWGKPCKKKTKDSRNEKILKIGHHAKVIPMQRLKPLQNGQFGSKIKNAKNRQKTILQKHQSCSVGKPSEKHPRFEKWEDFQNRPSCKGYSPSKG